MSGIQAVLKRAKQDKKVDEAKHGKNSHKKEPNGKSIYKSVVDQAVKEYKSKGVAKEHTKHHFWGKDMD